MSLFGLKCHIVVIGLEQANYSLNESNTPQILRLKLLSSPHSRGFHRPRLRLKSISGTASGELAL